MVIKNLENKIKLVEIVCVAVIMGCVVISLSSIWTARGMVADAQQKIYVLDGNVPILVQRTSMEETLDVEAKSHVEMFHQYFFNLPPDNDYIKWTVGKAMYMADGTALKQKQAMDENGFYSDIISSSAVCTIMCDSIQFDELERKFTYYGTQLIKRRTRDIRRSMVTTGYIESVPRTRNNPHGLLITGWRTLENRDLDY